MSGLINKLSRHSQAAKRTIQLDQAKRELLIGFMQLVFACHMTVLFYLTSEAVDRAHLNRVALILAAHVLGIFWRMWRATTHDLKWYDNVVSILLDFVVCGEIIFLQHGAIEKEVLATAPTFSYVYLLIAIRTLHLKPEYVIGAGLTAGMGWVLLVAANLLEAGLDVRSLFEYSTLREILLSGLVDKLLAITGTTIVLAAATARARSYFESSVVRAVAGQGLSKFINPDVAKEILMADGAIQPGQGRLRRASILMMDIRGFTGIASHLDPSQVMSLLREYQSRMVKIIHQYGGVVDKFMGDGILAHFGAVKTSATYAVDALNCVEALYHQAEKWNRERRAMGLAPLDFGIACASGDVIFGCVGGMGRMEFTIIGDSVNLTAKLEKHTKAIGVAAVTTARTWERAHQQGFLPRYPARRLKDQRVAGFNKEIELIAMCQPMVRQEPQIDRRAS